MKKKAIYSLFLKEFFIFFIMIIFALLLLINKEFAKSSFQGILLFACTILPSLFPYFFITTIISKLNLTNKLSQKLSPFSRKIFSVSGQVFFVFLIGLLSGYPIGAKMIADLKTNNLIDDKQAVRGSYLCATPSPMFLISTIGGVTFNNTLFGVFLYLSSTLSVVFLSFIFSFIKRDKVILDLPVSLQKNDNLFYNAIVNSVLSILAVGGIIVVFYILTDILAYYNILSPITLFITKIFNDSTIANGLTFGLFECTKGLKLLAGDITLFTLPTCAFISTFSGLSIIMQCVCHLKSAKIKIAPFLISKVIGAILSFILGLIFSVIFLV